MSALIARPSKNLGLHHVAMRVADVAAIRHFYVDLLGFAIEREVLGKELWLTTGSDSLVFLHGTPRHPAGDTLDHMGFIVPNACDVGAWETFLRAQGIPILEPTENFDDGSVGMICQDPAGHHVQALWHPNITLQG